MLRAQAVSAVVLISFSLSACGSEPAAHRAQGLSSGLPAPTLKILKGLGPHGPLNGLNFMPHLWTKLPKVAGEGYCGTDSNKRMTAWGLVQADEAQWAEIDRQLRDTATLLNPGQATLRHFLSFSAYMYYQQVAEKTGGDNLYLRAIGRFFGHAAAHRIYIQATLFDNVALDPSGEKRGYDFSETIRAANGDLAKMINGFPVAGGWQADPPRWAALETHPAEARKLFEKHEKDFRAYVRAISLIAAETQNVIMGAYNESPVTNFTVDLMKIVKAEVKAVDKDLLVLVGSAAVPDFELLPSGPAFQELLKRFVGVGFDGYSVHQYFNHRPLVKYLILQALKTMAHKNTGRKEAPALSFDEFSSPVENGVTSQQLFDFVKTLKIERPDDGEYFVGANVYISTFPAFANPRKRGDNPIPDEQAAASTCREPPFAGEAVMMPRTAGDDPDTIYMNPGWRETLRPLRERSGGSLTDLTNVVDTELKGVYFPFPVGFTVEDAKPYFRERNVPPMYDLFDVVKWMSAAAIMTIPMQGMFKLDPQGPLRLLEPEIEQEITDIALALAAVNPMAGGAVFLTPTGEIDFQLYREFLNQQANRLLEIDDVFLQPLVETLSLKMLSFD